MLRRSGANTHQTGGWRTASDTANREIATRLVVSARTVESHMRSILAKLGFPSRTEVATWAVRSDPESATIGP